MAIASYQRATITTLLNNGKFEEGIWIGIEPFIQILITKICKGNQCVLDLL